MKEIKFDKNINIMIFAQRTMVLLNKYNKDRGDVCIEGVLKTKLQRGLKEKNLAFPWACMLEWRQHAATSYWKKKGR